MKDTIYPIDIATGEYVQGIQMTDEEERKRRKKYWELRNAKELRRIDHGPLGYNQTNLPGEPPQL